MKRFLIPALAIVLLATPDANAGPFKRLRDRLFGAPEACPNGVCPTPAAPTFIPNGIPAQAPAQPKVMQQAAPQVVGGIGDGELIQRVLIRRLRDRAIDRAVRDGIPVPGGGTRKVSRAEAEKLVKRVSDEEIVSYAKAKGAKGGLGDGSFLNWLWENREAILKFILSILALFGDDDAPQARLAEPAVPYTIWVRTEKGAWEEAGSAEGKDAAYAALKVVMQTPTSSDGAIVRATLKP